MIESFNEKYILAITLLLIMVIIKKIKNIQDIKINEEINIDFYNKNLTKMIAFLKGRKIKKSKHHSHHHNISTSSTKNHINITDIDERIKKIRECMDSFTDDCSFDGNQENHQDNQKDIIVKKKLDKETKNIISSYKKKLAKSMEMNSILEKDLKKYKHRNKKLEYKLSQLRC